MRTASTADDGVLVPLSDHILHAVVVGLTVHQCGINRIKNFCRFRKQLVHDPMGVVRLRDQEHVEDDRQFAADDLGNAVLGVVRAALVAKVSFSSPLRPP